MLACQHSEVGRSVEPGQTDLLDPLGVELTRVTDRSCQPLGHVVVALRRRHAGDHAGVRAQSRVGRGALTPGQGRHRGARTEGLPEHSPGCLDVVPGAGVGEDAASSHDVELRRAGEVAEPLHVWFVEEPAVFVHVAPVEDGAHEAKAKAEPPGRHDGEVGHLLAVDPTDPHDGLGARCGRGRVLLPEPEMRAQRLTRMLAGVPLHHLRRVAVQAATPTIERFRAVTEVGVLLVADDIASQREPGRPPGG
jgi:hypothetical protein